MITIENISKRFNERILFSKLNLTFETGKIYALIGRSGCGKTTLLNMLAKLEPYKIGSIIYRNQELSEIKTSRFFRQELGYLFQNFGLLESQTIQENLDLGLVGQKIDKAEKRRKQKEALYQVGLDYLDLKQKVYELSGGESQRVALAKVILKNPPLILADEPTAALDPKTSREIMDILVGLKQANRLIIIATHNPMIWEMADEVISLNDLVN
ncbi:MULTISPECIES: ABC transporter ATP-binding protein [unclassified Granulicatella]|uniref:ABC transporter ATP-binding protein n=1 Tax=unclassified Granulicatella TaxID=2630493 RepID=UPI001073E084|nr:MULTISPECIES: ABC transporter ATP-binding protein [unclassified Granulicatella]MBF0781025.1 ABC transporter ATP-binding protein [Granulicatella sp. 19428wC4_WM01]TFU92565.1 ABC transporter ATP-binding protein [Granulicatella sp. WM01]